jgi:glucans biosynthesis protein
MSQDRRGFLIGAAVAAGAPGLAGPAHGAPAALGPPQPFSFGALKARARALAGAPFRPPPTPEPGLLALDFDALEKVEFDPGATLLGGPGEPAVRLIPVGRQFQTAVDVHLLRGGAARRVLPAADLFRSPEDSPYRRLRSPGLFAGFRVLNEDRRSDWLAFLGASYFRAAGPFNQYGASARGLAINSGGPDPEEFPRFSTFWLQAGPEGSLIVYALLEGPSVAGAFRFDNKKASPGVTQTVDCALYVRTAVRTLGVAPLTSMFWYGQAGAPTVRDWRPQIHDSDGLALFTGAGERLWRPLQDPPRVTTNAFLDEDPRGFGLLQRDRSFDHYQDDGAFYEKRPDVWIEPTAPFGAGSVRLVELPTTRETEDNIVAFWTPKAPVAAGQVLAFSYRILWIAEEPGLGDTARVVATRMGIGGRPGMPRPQGAIRMAVDFSGADLRGLDRLTGVEAVVTSPSGAKITNVSVYGVVGVEVWRLLFDVVRQGPSPVDLRAYLRDGARTLSETWIYQLF